MNKQTLRIVPISLIAILMSASLMSCGSSDSSPSADNAAPGAAPGAPPAQPGTVPAPAASWSQVKETTQCDPAGPSLCVGAYGFTVKSDGTYVVGPAPSGRYIYGGITKKELEILKSDVEALQRENLTEALTCNSASSTPLVQDIISITPTGQNPIVVYQYQNPPQGSECYRGSVQNSAQLHTDLNAIMVRYYKIPFPAPSPTPTPNGKTMNGVWGQDKKAKLTVYDAGASLKLGCSHAELTEPLVLNSAGEFNSDGKFIIDIGPMVIGDPREYPAKFTGKVKNDKMNLHIEYTNFANTKVKLDYNLTFGLDPEIDEICPL